MLKSLPLKTSQQNIKNNKKRERRDIQSRHKKKEEVKGR